MTGFRGLREWMGERCAMAACSQPDVERLCKIVIT